MKVNRNAFTLVEMIVAVGITAVLAALLLAIVTQTLGIWERSVSALNMNNEAERVLQRITEDWESAFARRDDHAWIDAVENGPWRFFTQVAATSGDSTDPNTLREVAYRWGDNRLYRVEGSAADALQSDYTWTPPDETDPEFLLAPNVLQLQMTGYDENGVKIDTITPENWPARVRVALRLISEDGARRLAAIADGVSDETIAQIEAQTARNYVRWIGIYGRAW